MTAASQVWAARQPRTSCRLAHVGFVQGRCRGAEAKSRPTGALLHAGRCLRLLAEKRRSRDATCLIKLASALGRVCDSRRNDSGETQRSAQLEPALLATL
jgi:hypothetical protein